MDDFFRFELPLKMLSKRHDVIAVHVEDLREVVMPDVGLVELEDEETGEQLTVDTSDEGFVKEYSHLMASQKSFTEKMFRKYKIDFVKINTKDGWVKPVTAYFRKKRKRRF